MKHTFKTTKQSFAIVKALKEQKKDFKLYATNYTLTIETAGNKLKYLNEKKDTNFFSTAKIVEKQVKESDNYINVYLHSFTMKKPEYFDTLGNIIPFKQNEVFNIDLNAAYPSALKAVELIDDATFQRLMKLPKLDRLGCIGILGSKKEIFKYEKGLLVEHETVEGRFRHIWKFVVNYVDQIMIELQNLCKNDFIFFWVDGIYLRKKPSYDLMQEIKYTIEEAGLQFKTEYLQDFNLERVNKKILIDYKKNGKTKHFEIPSKSQIRIKNSLIKALNL